MKKGIGVVVPDVIERKIILVRGQKVILDSQIAELYGVETKDLTGFLDHVHAKISARIAT